MTRADTQTLLRHATQALAPVAGELAALEARLLAQRAWGVTHEVLIRNATAAHYDAAALDALVARRLKHEPVAQILGKKEFWKDAFAVSRDVLTPRADSETLIALALKYKPDAKRILDLGTGSGCLLLSLLRECPQAVGVGIDRSEAALAVAARNAAALGLAGRAKLRRGDWCAGLASCETFDLIVSNPPYIPAGEIAALSPDVRLHEPSQALDGGKDGLDCTRSILSQVTPHLAENAILVMETGSGQMEKVAQLAHGRAFTVKEIAKDLAGIERAIAWAKHWETV
ncbi:MAG: peptide chain release factor N(5)-glutamine methyltransferase [Alphaproteobacteria bacterium]